MRILRIILIIGAVLLLVFLIANLVFRPTKKATNTAATTTTNVADEFAKAGGTDAVVSFQTDGVINGNDQHRQITISVSKNSRTLTVYQGYQGSVLSTQSFANNEDAFQSFLNAIYNAGFTKVKSNSTQTNIAGACPLGNRFIYSSQNIAGAPEPLWAATCSAKIGTFGGNGGTINSLFRLQIPNYNSLVNGVNLN